MSDLPARDYTRRPPVVARSLATGSITDRPRAKLKGVCPDGEHCRLAVHCSHLCSRLQAAEIAEEMRQSASRTRKGAGSVAPLDGLL